MLLILPRFRPDVQVPDSRWIVTPDAVAKEFLQKGHFMELPT